MPKSTLTRSTVRIITKAGVFGLIMFMARAPPSAPITIMPSSPMLIIPECSLKQPPSATSRRTAAKIKVYCIKSINSPYSPAFAFAVSFSLLARIPLRIVFKKSTKPQR